MKFIHPTAIVGFVLNTVAVIAMFSLLSGVDLSIFTKEEQDIIALMGELKTFFMVLLITQAVALGMLEYRIPGAMIVAFMSAFFTMPIGIIYLLGCVFTQNNVRFSGFDQQKDMPKQAARATFPSSQTKGMLLGSLIFLVFTVFMFTQQLPDMAVVGLFSAVTLGYMARRTVTMPPLVFYDDYMTVVPVSTASPVVLPYKDLCRATLLSDERIIFSVMRQSRRQDLQWRLSMVHKASRQEALELMADVLRAHHVVLE